MPELFIDENYKSILSLRETETAIKFIKDTFEEQLSNELNLQRISSVLFFTTSWTFVNEFSSLLVVDPLRRRWQL